MVGIRGVDVGAMSAGGAMGRGAMAGARGIQGMRDKAGQALQNAMGQGGRQDKEAAMRQRIGTLYQGGQASTTAYHLRRQHHDHSKATKRACCDVETSHFLNA